MDMVIIIGAFTLFFLIMFSPLISLRVIRPKTEILFLQVNEKNTYALVLTNAQSNLAAKGGAVSRYRFRLRKVDVRTNKLLFDTKYKSFTTKMLRGYATILGCSNQFAYLTSEQKDVTVFDINEGKKLADTKSIIAANLSVQGISVGEMQFDEEKKALVMYDKFGKQYLLVGDKLVTAADYKSDNNQMHVCNVWEGLKLDDSIRFTGYTEIQFAPVPNSKKKFIGKRDPLAFTEITYKDSFDTFLEPKGLLVKDENGKEFMLVQHQAGLDDDKVNIFISRVSLESKEIWKLNKHHLVSPELMNSKLHFYVSLYKNRLFIVYGDRGETSFSICEVSLTDGKMIQEPVFFSNRRKKV